MNHTSMEPAYLGLLHNKELSNRVRMARECLRNCELCGQRCGVDRIESKKGAICRSGEQAIVHSYGPHHGEEKALSGWAGSGTIFLGSCNMRCVYCQNFDISQQGSGHEVEPSELASMMLDLQDRGCHNINFVTPSHVVPQVLAAVELAARRGLRLPLVFNSGGYDSLEALCLCDGVFDIYMPDVKYSNSDHGKRYSSAPCYVEVNRAALREMHRQVGDLVLDGNGIAQRGLLLRHLVLPDGLAGTDASMEFIANELSTDSYVNIMAQYRPCYCSERFSALDRPLTPQEFREAVATARRHGLTRLD